MPVVSELREGVGVITLDRPARAHAYDRNHLEAMAAAFEDLSQKTVLVVLQSTGERAFCGGADLTEVDHADPLSALDLYSQRVFNAIARSSAVSIAAVQGAAVAGGCELALACDLRVVGPRASFRLPETSLGLIPSAGGTTRLTRLVGPSVAKQVILAGRSLDADAAVRLGLAMECIAYPRERAFALAQELRSRDPIAQRLAKQIIDRGEDPTSLDMERLAESLLYSRRSLPG